MTPTRIAAKYKAVGITAGVALFVAAGLFLTIAANRAVPLSTAPLPPLSPAVIAPAEELGRAFAAVAGRVKPAVVNVYSERMVTEQQPQLPFPFSGDFFGQFFGQQFPQQQQQQPHRVPEEGLGSGMILDREGYILTNYHVVKDFTTIQVQLSDQRKFPAEVVGTDPRTDVAVIRIKGSVPGDLPTVQLGDSDAMQDGDLVLAVGAPFGLTQTVTNGIISAKGRSNLGIADYEDFLQTDAPINPGNSGGPLVNMQGQVIGMNSAILTGGTSPGSEGQFGGVGFAIPINMIKAMLPTLMKGESIVRGMIGVVIQEVSPDLAKQFNLPNTRGALVSQVNPTSPAARAGLKSGDDIVRFDGHAIDATRDLRNLVAATAPGTKVPVEFIRDGQQETVTVTVGKLTSTVASATPNRSGAGELTKLGLRVQTLTPELANQYGLEEDHGVVITNVQEGSAASLADLQAGDIIVQADRKPVNSVAELENVVASAKSQILLLISRKGTSAYVVLQLQ
jgi:serine protease Do